jgi:hypothetical protein
LRLSTPHEVIFLGADTYLVVVVVSPGLDTGIGHVSTGPEVLGG